MVPRAYYSLFLQFASLYNSWNHTSVFDSPGWNNHWKQEFGLADKQLTAAQLRVLDLYTSKWSRNAVVEYMLKPTFGRSFTSSLKEALSQWTNPEIVVPMLSLGIARWQGVANKALKPLGRGSTGRTAAKNLQEQLAMEEIMANPSSGKILIEHIKDTRWNSWSKMSNRTAHGVEIHYNALWKNKKIVAVDDFKFVD